MRQTRGRNYTTRIKKAITNASQTAYTRGSQIASNASQRASNAKQYAYTRGSQLASNAYTRGSKLALNASQKASIAKQYAYTRGSQIAQAAAASASKMRQLRSFQPTQVSSEPIESSASSSEITPLNSDTINNEYLTKYQEILNSMFDERPTSNRIGEADPRAWPVVNNVITMEQFPKPFARSYKQHTFPEHLLRCQPIGGFKLELEVDGKISDDFNVAIDYLTNGEGSPTNIFKRLALIAKDNLVAISEAGTLKPKQYNKLMIEQLNLTIQKNIDECLKFHEHVEGLDKDNFTFNDTGYISGAFNETDIADRITTSTKAKIINSNGIVILNCHLDSRGPKNLDTDTLKMDWTNKLITFLGSELPNIASGENPPNVLVGDTNITVNKTVNIKEFPHEKSVTREQLLECMLKGITQKYGATIDTCWVLITSSRKIKKIRSGFLLLNNQMNKANNEETIEEDGTIIAIRTNVAKIGMLNEEFCNKNFGKNWHVCYKLPKPPDGPDPKFVCITPSGVDTSTIDMQHVNFLKFTDLNNCMTDNMPNDEIFIDHSVLAVSKDALLELINIEQSKQTEWKNLVVLNLGSIINSDNPWNIQLLEKDILSKIQKADEWLFNRIVPVLTNEKLEYKSYKGSDFGKLPFEKRMIPQFANAMTKVHMYLESELPGIFNSIDYPTLSVKDVTQPVEPESVESQPIESQPIEYQPTLPMATSGGYQKSKKIRKERVNKINRKTNRKIRS